MIMLLLSSNLLPVYSDAGEFSATYAWLDMPTPSPIFHEHSKGLDLMTDLPMDTVNGLANGRNAVHGSTNDENSNDRDNAALTLLREGDDEMKQYYVDAPNDGVVGNDLNLFVTAAGPAAAISLWIEYYDISPQGLADLSVDTRISLCPRVAASAVAHRWGDIESWNLTPDGGVGPFTPRGD